MCLSEHLSFPPVPARESLDGTIRDASTINLVVLFERDQTKHLDSSSCPHSHATNIVSNIITPPGVYPMLAHLPD